MTQQRQQLDILLFGPDDASIDATAAAIQQRLPQEAAPPTEPGTISLRPSLEQRYRYKDARLRQYTLPAQTFFGECISQLGGDAVHILALPLDPWDLLSQRQLSTLFFVLRALGAPSLVLAMVMDPIQAPHEERPELQQVIQRELQEQLSGTGWSETDISICFIDTPGDVEQQDLPRHADAQPLFDVLDRALKTPQRDPRHDPFLMPIEDKFNIEGHSTIVTGRILQGEVDVGDMLILLHASFATKRIGGIEMFRKKLKSAHAGDVVGLMLEHTQWDELKRGDILTKSPESFERTTQVLACIHLLANDRGGQSTPHAQDTITLSIHTARRDAHITKIHQDPWQWHQTLKLGHTLIVNLQLNEPIWCRPGMVFHIRQQSSSAGVGILLPNQPHVSPQDPNN